MIYVMINVVNSFMFLFPVIVFFKIHVFKIEIFFNKYSTLPFKILFLF